MKNYILSFKIFSLISVFTLSNLTHGYSEEKNKLIETLTPQINIMIKEYILENPEIIEEAFLKLQSKKELAKLENQKISIEKNQDLIFNSPHDGVLGNPEGKYTIVEFFDYNCGYCKKGLQDLKQITEKNDQIKFVLKEFPILGVDSYKVHQISLALKSLMPKQYKEFHSRILSFNGSVNEEIALNIARDLGVEKKLIEEKIKDPTIEKIIGETLQLAESLGISGTPAYIIGDEVIPGAVGVIELMRKIAKTAKN